MNGNFTAEARRKPLKHRGKEEAEGGIADIRRKTFRRRFAQMSADENGNSPRRRGGAEKTLETQRKGGSGGTWEELGWQSVFS
jgi:hypothetical protein